MPTPSPSRNSVVAADLIDGLRVAYLDDGRIGRTEPTGEVGRHVRIARAQVIGDRICNWGADIASLHDPVDLAGDLAGAGRIGDGLPVGLRPVNHIAWACEQLRMCLEIRALLRFDPALRPRDNLPVPVLDLLRGQAVCAHLLTDCPFHRPHRALVIVEPLADRFRFHDTVPAQHVLPFQKRAEVNMHIVENVARLFQIGTAFEVQVTRLGHLGEIIGDPLMLKRGTRGPGFDPGHNFRCADPRAAQGGVYARPQVWLGQTVQPAGVNIRLGIDPALRGGL